MTTKIITSLQHPKVLYWTQLRKEKSFRDESQSILITGKVLLYELSQKFAIKSLITIEETPEIAAKEKFTVTEGILQKITGLKNSGGFAAELQMPLPQTMEHRKKILILDQITDPGNLGTLVRTAHALGWEGVIATPGTVDFFNDKALRASRGAIFHLPYLWQTREQIQQLAIKNSLYLLVADTEGDSLDKAPFQKPYGLILSNEARGAVNWTTKLTKKVTIPMCDEAESLNVATAGAILLYVIGKA